LGAAEYCINLSSREVPLQPAYGDFPAMYHGSDRRFVVTVCNLARLSGVARDLNSIKQPDVWTFGFMPFSHLGIPI
jgi:hypothetical protein